MYDEDARVLGPGCHDRGHWYDEPPYESDPEDFLMGSNSPVPTATIQNGRVCFTLNLRNEPRGEGVISLRSAGDISLPRDGPCAGTPRGTPRRGLILPQAGYPPTIIPLTHSRLVEDSNIHLINIKTSTTTMYSKQIHFLFIGQLGTEKAVIMLDLMYRALVPDFLPCLSKQAGPNNKRVYNWYLLNFCPIPAVNQSNSVKSVTSKTAKMECRQAKVLIMKIQKN